MIWTESNVTEHGGYIHRLRKYTAKQDIWKRNYMICILISNDFACQTFKRNCVTEKAWNEELRPVISFSSNVFSFHGSQITYSHANTHTHTQARAHAHTKGCGADNGWGRMQVLSFLWSFPRTGGHQEIQAETSKVFFPGVWVSNLMLFFETMGLCIRGSKPLTVRS